MTVPPKNQSTEFRNSVLDLSQLLFVHPCMHLIIQSGERQQLRFEMKEATNSGHKCHERAKAVSNKRELDTVTARKTALI
jgi:hypothetical protein